MNEDASIPEEDINWSSSFFAKIIIGGVWAVPRSGLTFRKVDEATFVLDAVAWVPGIPNPEKLLEYQREDYKVISLRFRAAGINMSDPKKLLEKGNMKEETSNVKLGEGSKSWRSVT
jgi:hypothetical protein